MKIAKNKHRDKLSGNGMACCISAVVLGLNDALVELTGALAGFTMALGNNRLIAIAGLTTGVAATLSMAASEFLSQEKDPAGLKPATAACLTGVTYMLTVAVLLLPYFMFDTPGVSLAICLTLAGLIILLFTYISSRLLQTRFWHDFLQMLGISFGVAAIAFSISWIARQWWGVAV